MTEDIHKIVGELEVELIKYGITVDFNGEGYVLNSSRNDTALKLILERLELEAKIETISLLLAGEEINGHMIADGQEDKAEKLIGEYRAEIDVISKELKKYEVSNV